MVKEQTDIDFSLDKNRRSSGNLVWVNYVRFICIVLVYYYHSSIKIGYEENHFFRCLYEPFFVNAFFFISGYLLFRKYQSAQFYMLDNSQWNGTYGKDFLKNIVYKIAVPTLLFSTVFTIPKLLLRGFSDDVLFQVEKSTILGCSLWFTSALVVAELICYIIFKFYRSKNYLFYFIISIILAIIGTSLTNSGFTIAGDPDIPWLYKSGMIATLFIFLGGGIFEIRKSFGELVYDDEMFFSHYYDADLFGVFYFP